MEYADTGIELTTPYYQVDVELPRVCTILKGYLAYGSPEIGMKVKACFRTVAPPNTIIDMCWIPHEATT